jgi:hypothetical protein
MCLIQPPSKNILNSNCTHHSRDCIDWEVARGRVHELADRIHNPNDIWDKTQSGDDVEPKEETVFEISLNHRVNEDLKWEKDERNYQKGVEIHICVFVC